MEQLERTWEVQESGERLDVFVAAQAADLTRSYVQKLIGEGRASVNGRVVKANYRLRAGDVVCLRQPQPQELSVQAEEIPLDIVYEDGDLLVINKPKGMVVHPAAGHYEGTLVNALLHHCRGSLSGIGGVLRPGIVHRIDKDTSGLLLVAKNDAAHQGLSAQLKKHEIARVYQAVVCGRLKEECGTVDRPIGRHPQKRKQMCVTSVNAKPAVTHYRVLEQWERYTLVECRLETGRTHQIRVHMAYLGHPLLGDRVYGYQKQPFETDGQVLHAKSIRFFHPGRGEEMFFETPLPDYFERVLKKIR